MKMLEMIFGKKKPQFVERIWSTKQGKMNDLVSHLHSDTGRGGNSVVVTHFQETHRSLLELLPKHGLNCHTINGSSQFPSGMPDVFNQNGQILMLPSDAIPSFVAGATGSQPKNATLPPVSVYLIEHYPLLERDQRVLDLDLAWPMRLEFTCFTSIDEPWLSSFGLDRMGKMFPKQGTDKEEVMEHPMLSKAIQSAQKRLATKVSREQVCASCQEWVRKNLSRSI